MIMYTICQDKLPHIIIEVINKYYITACNINILKNKKITTLSFSSILDGGCKKCTSIFNTSYYIDPSSDPRGAYSSQNFLYDVLEYQQLNLIGPIAKFNLIQNRKSRFINKIKKHVK